MATLRDLLFADLSLSEWVQHAPDAGEPWDSFVKAQAALDRDDEKTAVDLLTEIAASRDIEALHHAQAWRALRELGFSPAPENEKDLLGVVIEVGLEAGLDLLAVYPDGTARYYNHAGGGEVWERPDDSLDSLTGPVLAAGRELVHEIGPWHAAKPEPPPATHVRINLLTPSGLHFGEGPFALLLKDPKAAPILSAATTLMVALVKRREQEIKRGFEQN